MTLPVVASEKNIADERDALSVHFERGSGDQIQKAHVESQIQTAQRDSRRLVWSAFAVLVVTMFSTMAGTYWACAREAGAFSSAIQETLNSHPLNHFALTAYTNGMAASYAKMFPIVLSFLLIFAGSVYVLLPVKAVYSGSINHGGATGSFETTSPGLVIVTLGVVLAITAIWHPVSVSYEGPPDQARLSYVNSVATSGGVQLRRAPEQVKK